VFRKQQGSDKRTAEDRARAAAERAERRAEREGGDPEPPPPETFGTPATPAGQRATAEVPEFFEDEPTVRRISDEPDAVAGEPEAAEPAPGRFADEPAAEPAPPPRRATAVEDRPAPLAPRRIPPNRTAALTPRARPGGRWRRRIGAVIALALIGGALYLINAIFQPFHGGGEGSVRVSIPSGADAGQIGDVLAAKGVVDNAGYFEVNATLTRRRGKLRPGNYTLQRNMSYGEAIEALMQGPKVKVVETTQITLPEGPSRRELAPIVRKSGIEGDYLRASGSRAALRQVRRLGAPRRARTTEGFLFPATYELVEGSPAADLVDKQLEAFRTNFRDVDLSYAKRKNLTRYDVLIIASLVEREAQLARERPLIAAVIYNRLSRGMPLGIDATIRYETRNWTRPIRVSELEADTPYNTRLRRGLPPTPIGNPGKASLRAAAKPSRKGYLFFVRKPGKSGEHAFSSTNAQFEKDVARYQASRGGP
jgi:uncharacterized YceG family protein